MSDNPEKPDHSQNLGASRKTTFSGTSEDIFSGASEDILDVLSGYGDETRILGAAMIDCIDMLQDMLPDTFAVGVIAFDREHPPGRRQAIIFNCRPDKYGPALEAAAARLRDRGDA